MKTQEQREFAAQQKKRADAKAKGLEITKANTVPKPMNYGSAVTYEPKPPPAVGPCFFEPGQSDFTGELDVRLKSVNETKGMAKVASKLSRILAKRPCDVVLLHCKYRIAALNFCRKIVQASTVSKPFHLRHPGAGRPTRVHFSSSSRKGIPVKFATTKKSPPKVPQGARKHPKACMNRMSPNASLGQPSSKPGRPKNSRTDQPATKAKPKTDAASARAKPSAAVVDAAGSDDDGPDAEGLYTQAEDFVLQVQRRFSDDPRRFSEFIAAVRCGENASWESVEAKVLKLLDGHKDLVRGLYNFLPGTSKSNGAQPSKANKAPKPEKISKTKPPAAQNEVAPSSAPVKNVGASSSAPRILPAPKATVKPPVKKVEAKAKKKEVAPMKKEKKEVHLDESDGHDEEFADMMDIQVEAKAKKKEVAPMKKEKKRKAELQLDEFNGHVEEFTDMMDIQVEAKAKKEAAPTTTTKKRKAELHLNEFNAHVEEFAEIQEFAERPRRSRPPVAYNVETTIVDEWDGLEEALRASMREASKTKEPKPKPVKENALPGKLAAAQDWHDDDDGLPHAAAARKTVPMNTDVGPAGVPRKEKLAVAEKRPRPVKTAAKTLWPGEEQAIRLSLAAADANDLGNTRHSPDLASAPGPSRTTSPPVSMPEFNMSLRQQPLKPKDPMSQARESSLRRLPRREHDLLVALKEFFAAEFLIRGQKIPCPAPLEDSVVMKEVCGEWEGARGQAVHAAACGTDAESSGYACKHDDAIGPVSGVDGTSGVAEVKRAILVEAKKDDIEVPVEKDVTDAVQDDNKPAIDSDKLPNNNENHMKAEKSVDTCEEAEKDDACVAVESENETDPIRCGGELEHRSATADEQLLSGTELEYRSAIVGEGDTKRDCMEKLMDEETVVNEKDVMGVGDAAKPEKDEGEKDDAETEDADAEKQSVTLQAEVTAKSEEKLPVPLSDEDVESKVVVSLKDEEQAQAAAETATAPKDDTTACSTEADEQKKAGQQNGAVDKNIEAAPDTILVLAPDDSNYTVSDVDDQNHKESPLHALEPNPNPNPNPNGLHTLEPSAAEVLQPQHDDSDGAQSKDGSHTTPENHFPAAPRDHTDVSARTPPCESEKPRGEGEATQQEPWEDFDQTMVSFMGREGIGEMRYNSGSEWYHAQNFQLLTSQELIDAIDSEDEMTYDWIMEMNSVALEQFTDVRRDDKDFMHLWTDFVTRERVIADWEIVAAVPEFLRRHAEVLSKRAMRSCLIMHLLTLHQLGVLKPDEIEQMVEVARIIVDGGELPEQFMAPPEGLSWRESYKKVVNVDRMKHLEMEAEAMRQKEEQQKANWGDLGRAKRNFVETLVAEDYSSGLRPKRQRHASSKLATALQTTSEAQLLQSVLRNSLLDK